MSYKSLLFCADEKAARLVTQVLSELDFTVELATETYATAKRLAEEHFDALVVDCQNEQDASVLFKAARNSAENHSSLSVAVVDGPAGVAKAFRIGANLVLTKPINVEQSKGTLRVARGLLKKNQAKPAASGATDSTPTSTFVPPSAKPAVPAAPAFSTPSPSSLPPAFTPVAPAAAVAHASAPAVPYAGLQVDKDPEPAPEAADVAVLESLPQLPVAKPAEPVSASLTSLGLDKPFVAGSAAAAAAPAVEKKIVERSAGSFSPLVTNEPIIREATAPTPFEMHAPVPAPTFSTLDSRRKESGNAAGIFKTILAFGLLGVAFYLGWQKLPGVLQNHHFSWPHRASQQPAPQRIEASAPTPAPSATAQTPAPATEPAMTPPATDTTTSPSGSAPAAEQIAAGAPSGTATPGNVEVQEMPMARDAKITVTPQPKPLVVKTDDDRPSERRTATPVAPSLSVANTNPNSPIADLVTSNAPLPKPVPGTIRISQGVSQGLLMKKVSPVYPPMAIQFRKEGMVEMLATIDTEGSISNVKVLSGDPMLARAAADAVKQWAYRPYLLNGQPLAVETQISISFKLPR